MAIQQRRLAQSRAEGGFALRVYHQKERRKRMPRFLVKCGCCEQRLEIYYSSDFLEINGVCASVENWRELLLPLLYPNSPIPGNRTESWQLTKGLTCLPAN
jgi:hypothetical protein